MGVWGEIGGREGRGLSKEGERDDDQTRRQGEGDILQAWHGGQKRKGGKPNRKRGRTAGWTRGRLTQLKCEVALDGDSLFARIDDVEFPAAQFRGQMRILLERLGRVFQDAGLSFEGDQVHLLPVVTGEQVVIRDKFGSESHQGVQTGRQQQAEPEQSGGEQRSISRAGHGDTGG